MDTEDYIMTNPAELSTLEIADAYEAAWRCFTSSYEFLRDMDLPLPEVTPSDKREALNIFHESPLAPEKPTTLGAARMLDKMLAKHDYSLVNPHQKMRNYVMYKFFELAENEDPKISLKALENLAKVSDIGLFTEKLEVSINQKTTVELESELGKLLKSLIGKAPNKAIEGEYRELSDEELKGL